MRILVVTNTYPPADITGVGALVYELARQLGTSGHHVRVLTREAPAEDPYAVGTTGPKLLFPLSAGWRYLRLGETYDLVHLHESDGVFVALALRLARLLGRPAGAARLVATLQVSYLRERKSVRPVRANGTVVSRPTASERIFGWLRAPLLSLFGRLTAHLSDAVVAPSRKTAQELEDDYGAQVVAVIPNGVTDPEDEIPATPPALDPAPGSPTLLYAGRLRTRKAVAVLVEAFARLSQEHPQASLVIAGDGEHRRALEARVNELGLGDRAHFLGSVPRQQLLGWYGRVDIFCLPSIYEGFPVAILEAMAAGLPVVSTTVSGIPEAIDDEVTGLLVPPEDATALAAALGRLANDSDLRRRLGAGARQAVRQRFSIAKVSAEYLDLWRKIHTEST